MATSGEEAAGGGSGISASDHSAPGPFRAPQLVRARSGPATLSHAVFEMLYVQLRNVLGGLRKARSSRARERARAKDLEASNARRAAAAEAAAAAAAAAAAVDDKGTDGEEADGESETADGVADVSTASGGEETSPAAVAAPAAAAVADEGGESGTAEDGVDEKGEEEKAVFERLADMRDDIGCLKLSRELQVCVSVSCVLHLAAEGTCYVFGKRLVQ